MSNQIIPTDPLSLHNYILDRLAEGDNPLLDPTNPYTMLLESSILSALQVNDRLKLHMHKYFPGIARDMEDLSYHITNMDEFNLFNTPAKAVFRFYIELNNFLSNAIYIENDKRYIATIPKYTRVTIDNIPFTIMADVKVNVINIDGQFRSFIEHVIDDNVVDLKNIGNLNSIITKDENNVDWIVFDLPLVQVLVEGYTVAVTKNIEFDINIPIKDQYNNSIVTCKIGDEIETLQNIYVESKYDLDSPSIYIKINNDSVNYKIPKYYIDNGMIDGEVDFLIFTTKGKINLRLGDYNKDLFEVKLGPVNDMYEEAMSRITLISDSQYVVNGGTNTITFRELKKKIIYRTNNISIPVTERQLIEASRKLGFTIFKDKDTILDRLYLATTIPYGKEITNSVNINTTFLTIETHIKYIEDLQDSVVYNNDYIIIDKGTVFIDKNNIVNMLPKSELDRIKLLNNLDSVYYINENTLYMSPYRYIFDLSRDILDFRAYDIDSYFLDRKEIIIKNKDTLENVNIVAYNIFRDDTKYYLFFKLFGNDHYELIKNDIKLQMKIPTNVINEYIYLHSVLDLELTKKFYPDAEEPYHCIEIDTDRFINETDEVTILNGFSKTTARLVNIFTRPEISIYTTRMDIINNNNINALNLNRGNIYYNNDVLNAITFTIENIDLSLMKRLEYILNKVNVIENNRIYERYDTDIYERYSTNKYKIDPTIGCEVTLEVSENGECTNVTQEAIHNTGDYVLDNNGNKIIKYHKGDIKLNDEGEPIINKVGGIEMLTKLLLIDYKFEFSKKDIYLDNIKRTIEFLTNIITNNLKELNDLALDNTKILYASRYSNEPIKLNGGDYINDCIVKPKVNIYIDEVNRDLISIDTQLINKIGNIITAYLNKKYISIDDIEKELLNKIKYATAIQVLNITDANLKTIKIENNINRFRINTIMDKSRDIIYDIDVNIITI